MRPNSRIKKLREASRILSYIQNDINRHTKAWYPIFTKSGGDPITMVSKLNDWVGRLGKLADAAIVVEQAKEESKRGRDSA